MMLYRSLATSISGEAPHPLSGCVGHRCGYFTTALARLRATGELLGVCAADAVFSGSTGWAWPDGVWSDELGDMPNAALVLGDALEADSEDAFALEISACAEATASEACRVSFEVPPQALNKQTPATVQESSTYSFRAELFIRGSFLTWLVCRPS